jgi:hypothetical protein
MRKINLKRDELILSLWHEGFLVFDIYKILRVDIDYIYSIIDNQ